MLSTERRRLVDGADPAFGLARMTLRLRASGVLQIAARGPVLVTADGAWLLETDEDLASLDGKHVVAEGVRQGFDHIRVDYVAAAEPSS